MTTEVLVEQEGVNDDAVQVVSWLAADGAEVTAGTPLVEVETSKVAVEVPSPGDGYLVRVAAAGQVVAVGGVLARICSSAAEADSLRGSEKAVGAEDTSTDRFSRSALAFVREHGIDLLAFDGFDLVTLDDAERVHRSASAHAGRTDGIVPLSRAKTVEVERLLAANVLNAALSVQFDGTALRASCADADLPSLRQLALFVRAVAVALCDFPDLNAFYDNGIRHYDSINVGVAIDLGDGLQVGVVHGADQADGDDVEARVADLMARYVDADLELSDVTGATVTVSDLSMDGVLSFQPLLNHRQALAIGVGGDPSLPGEPFTITATFDHRVTSGREVSQFLGACRRELGVSGA
ncbi:2-oxo acid dehydrogenase subunit E2 [Lentzea flaviverrucosa]|uniref:Dihydrolipoamide acetyltransferase component of pyruvate dehydrogenase complex n=1 Tax=Lentzea flaviverrucosa TaxID=200379 RepID=A0A1H9WUY5_9PSEU|nr:2-oxo acid dehydrogenase subunit E2 [Lentzea flaviverrucosa]RDI23113.1 2-oxoglutarate dehydrogenase E2 component (dihydrolipoamide succinyltransferase) [Lentzea flaviverrucosa]SES37507.1 2-oxoglutarate dehydrogenase E2 component (dihydrolipoamide succinyltransferase) [Lentzea flaviverrucosa]